MAVSFSDLHTAEGLKALEANLAGKTYISGDAISKDDIKVFAAVPGAEFPNAARWYDTVSAAVASRFPGKAAGVNLAGAGASSAPAAAAPAAEASKDAEGDDDLDLFGDETEDDKKVAEELAASKASTKKKESGKSSVLMDVKPWDDETDMKKSKEAVRSVHLEGPTWGACMADATESEHLAEEEEEQEEGMAEGEEGLGSEGEEEEGCKKRKRPLKKSLDGFSKRGVYYLSRVPPHMNPSHVRQMFSKYGEVQRIYLFPEGMVDATESEHLAEEEEQEEGMAEGEEGLGSEGEEEEGCKKRKHPLKKCLDGFSKRGVCYLSRVPPHMNPSHVRQMFSKYGEVQRIYLVPEGQGHRKHANVRAKAYSEGWIEFAKKSVAKRVANLLNGEQIGGKKRSSFYYDIWNIKYLRKFKWDDLVGEIAEKTHIREQKLTLEITAAKKQRDHYLSNAEKSRTQKIIRERIRKKQKTEGKESNDVVQTKFDHPIPQQKKRIERGPRTNSELSKDILAGVFSGSS